jgi:hypothetical protein
VDNPAAGIARKKNPALRRDFPQCLRTRSLTPLPLLPGFLMALVLLLLAGLLATTLLLLLTRLLARVLALLTRVLVRIVLVRHGGISLR